ncbi:MAG: hypothetical protein IJU10_01245 [Clostridia bacterium]|nr:hypothetical protein [Clostridia bacterium]
MEKKDPKAQNAELMTELRRLIPDENLRLYIFGENDDDVLNKKSLWKGNNYYKYINNVLNLSFMYVYACYRRMIDNIEEIDVSAFSSNAKRVYDILSKLYIGRSVNTELIQFVLIDLYIDLTGENTLGEYIPDFMQTGRKIDFHSYFRKVMEWQKTSRLENDLDEMQGMFMKLLPCLSYLRNVSLDGENDDFIFRVKGWKDESKFYCNRTIIKVNMGRRQRFYFLESLTVTNTKLMLSYNTIDGSGCINYYIAEDEPEVLELGDDNSISINRNCGDVFCEITGQRMEGEDSPEQKGFIEDIHTINYRYIKNLALSISDSMSDDDKRNLFNRFYGTYPSSFASTAPAGAEFSVDHYNWDNVSIILLIEASPTKVLYELLYFNPQIMRPLLKELGLRFHGSLSVCKLTPKELDAKVQEYYLNNKLTGFIQREENNIGAFSEKRNAEIKARLIVDSLNSYSVADKPTRHGVSLWSIDEIILSIEKIQQNSDKDLQLKMLTEVMGGVFRRLICFYRGIFAYAAVMDNFDVTAFSRALNEDEIKAFQDQAIKAFHDEAKVWADKLKKTPVPSDEFIKLCEDCAFNSGSVRDETKYMRSVIGKSEIIIGVDLKKLLGAGFDWTEKNKQNIDKLIANSMRFLQYIKNGGFKTHNVVDAVYPSCAVYISHFSNRDGYRTMTFLLTGEGGHEDKEIKILTDFKYRMGEAYYCLPNVARSNKNWWIEPFIVNCRDFDELFD